MASMFENIQAKRFFPKMPYKDDLPVSQLHGEKPSLRKRISSFSVNIQPLSSASTEWALRKSKSLPSFGAFSASGSLRKWWNLGWQWIMSRKPSFAEDLEMNEEESAMLGWQSKGSLSHVFYKVRSQFTKLMQNNTLPTTQKFSYEAHQRN